MECRSSKFIADNSLGNRTQKHSSGEGIIKCYPRRREASPIKSPLSCKRSSRLVLIGQVVQSGLQIAQLVAQTGYLDARLTVQLGAIHERSPPLDVFSHLIVSLEPDNAPKSVHRKRGKILHWMAARGFGNERVAITQSYTSTKIIHENIQKRCNVTNRFRVFLNWCVFRKFTIHIFMYSLFLFVAHRSVRSIRASSCLFKLRALLRHSQNADFKLKLRIISNTL